MTDLECANRALNMLGVAPVGSLTDDTQSARVMNAMLPLTKKAVLSEFAWSFALKLAVLNKSPVAAPPGFSVTFTMPSDAENIIQVYRGKLTLNEGNWRTHLIKLNFIIQNGVICTNEEDCSVEYTYSNLTLSSWSAAACEALAVRLASDAAAALTGGQSNGTVLLQKYQYMAQNAVGRSATAEDIAQVLNTHYIDSRW